MNELHTTAHELFFTTLFLLLTTHARNTVTRRSLFLWATGAGFALGLAAVTRPNALVALPLMVWMLLQSPRRLPFCDVRFGAFLLTVVALLPPLCVTLRNVLLANDPVFIASQGGINLYLGNRVGADGFTPRTPVRYSFATEYEDSVELYGQKAAEEAAGHTLKPGDSQKYWVAQTFAVWREHPGQSLSLFGKKWLLAWNHREIRNNTSFEYVRGEWTPILWLAFGSWGIVAPMAVVGMVLAFRFRPDVRPFILFVPLYLLSFVLFFAADRFRLPVVPILCLFGGYALVMLFEAIRARQVTLISALVSVFVASYAFMNINWVETETPQTAALDFWSAGNRLIAQKKFEDALPQLEKALQRDEKNPDIWNSVGEAYYYLQRPGDAKVAFQNVAALDPARAPAYFNLALCALAEKNRDAARVYLVKTLSLDPQHSGARREWVALTGK